MADSDERQLFVPLRSNASQLVAGAQVEAIRRKLKYASVAYDGLLFEDGALRIAAGEGGSSTFPVPDRRFQPVFDRRVGMRSGFSIAVGAEETPGVPAPSGAMRTVAMSPTAAISWTPTLIPFEDELPATCDWVTWVSTARSFEVSKLASSWSFRDRNNDALLSAVPVSFARSLIIDHANTDLALAALNGVAVMQDATHRQVVSSRLDSATTWQPVGFAVPLLAPQVGTLSWPEIASLRADKAMRDYRSMLRELEAEALQQAVTDQDVERTVNVLLHKRLLKLAEPPRGSISALFNGVVSFFVGSGIGAITTGWTGPVGILGGAALGTAVDVGRMALDRSRARSARRWVSLHQRLAGT
jgi:hypothetical protein